MLGKTAGGLFWLCRYLERCENTARLVEAGFRIALTRPRGPNEEWAGVIDTAGCRAAYLAKYPDFIGGQAIDFLLRDRDNPSSVISCMDRGRLNARLVRTALTREVWEAVNESWMTLSEALKRPVRDRDLPEVLGLIRRQSALVRGALHGSMLRDDVFDFCRIGTFLERADNTARILDVKYYVLLPSVSAVGSSLDNVQWETVLRSVAGDRALGWLTGGDITPMGIADFLILDRRMPRSLRFAVGKIAGNLGYLERTYGARHPSHDLVGAMKARLDASPIEAIFDTGLHEFILDFLRDSASLGAQIEQDFRFYG
jgi:uncharacterized alpha-E superfamily protein